MLISHLFYQPFIRIAGEFGLHKCGWDAIRCDVQPAIFSCPWFAHSQQVRFVRYVFWKAYRWLVQHKRGNDINDPSGFLFPEYLYWFLWLIICKSWWGFIKRFYSRFTFSYSLLPHNPHTWRINWRELDRMDNKYSLLRHKSYHRLVIHILISHKRISPNINPLSSRYEPNKWKLKILYQKNFIKR